METKEIPTMVFSKEELLGKKIMINLLRKNLIEFQPTHNYYEDYEAVIKVKNIPSLGKVEAMKVLEDKEYREKVESMLSILSASQTQQSSQFLSGIYSHNTTLHSPNHVRHPSNESQSFITIIDNYEKKVDNSDDYSQSPNKPEGSLSIEKNQIGQENEGASVSIFSSTANFSGDAMNSQVMINGERCIEHAKDTGGRENIMTSAEFSTRPSERPSQTSDIKSFSQREVDFSGRYNSVESKVFHNVLEKIEEEVQSRNLENFASGNGSSQTTIDQTSADPAYKGEHEKPVSYENSERIKPVSSQNSLQTPTLGHSSDRELSSEREINLENSEKPAEKEENYKTNSRGEETQGAALIDVVSFAGSVQGRKETFSEQIPSKSSSQPSLFTLRKESSKDNVLMESVDQHQSTSKESGHFEENKIDETDLHQSDIREEEEIVEDRREENNDISVRSEGKGLLNSEKAERAKKVILENDVLKNLFYKIKESSNLGDAEAIKIVMDMLTKTLETTENSSMVLQSCPSQVETKANLSKNSIKLNTKEYQTLDKNSKLNKSSASKEISNKSGSKYPINTSKKHESLTGKKTNAKSSLITPKKKTYSPSRVSSISSLSSYKSSENAVKQLLKTEHKPKKTIQESGRLIYSSSRQSDKNIRSKDQTFELKTRKLFTEPINSESRENESLQDIEESKDYEPQSQSRDDRDVEESEDYVTEEVEEEEEEKYKNEEHNDEEEEVAEPQFGGNLFSNDISHISRNLFNDISHISHQGKDLDNSRTNFQTTEYMTNMSNNHYMNEVEEENTKNEEGEEKDGEVSFEEEVENELYNVYIENNITTEKDALRNNQEIIKRINNIVYKTQTSPVPSRQRTVSKASVKGELFNNLTMSQNLSQTLSNLDMSSSFGGRLKTSGFLKIESEKGRTERRRFTREKYNEYSRRIFRNLAENVEKEKYKLVGKELNKGNKNGYDNLHPEEVIKYFKLLLAKRKYSELEQYRKKPKSDDELLLY